MSSHSRRKKKLTKKGVHGPSLFGFFSSSLEVFLGSMFNRKDVGKNKKYYRVYKPH